MSNGTGIGGIAAILTSLGSAERKPSLPHSNVILFTLAIISMGLLFFKKLSLLVRFLWHCLFAPLGKYGDQKGRLNQFYSGQAEIYDASRSNLLRGRDTMLKLSAAHLLEQRRLDPSKRLVWLDIGGGTGWNIEKMNEYLPISEFDAVYVLDLCAPLLEISKRRFAALGSKNVTCLLQDATTFTIPDYDGADSLDFVTMSYSLSMMPDFYALLDRVDVFLAPSGLFSVCDFYVSSREKSSLSEIIGDVASRHCGWLSRLFWLNWFEFDHVDLHESRRRYLEHVFGTIKSFNGRNDFILPWIIQIPYYVTLATSRRKDTSAANVAFEVDAGNTISASASPMISAAFQTTLPPDLDIGLSSLAVTSVVPPPSFSSFHFGQKQFRVPYLDLPVHKEFRTWIYGFTWEDPAVDLQHLQITKDDSILAITSAGDNILHYAIASNARRIHGVDMNPCQGHLMELKLAAISALSYDDFWMMFGEGKHPHFRELLDSKISPFLTSHAYQFWRANDAAFSSSFYLRGYSGWALRLAKFALKLGGLEKDTHNFCHAPTLVDQRRIWDEKFRPVILSRWIVKIFLSNPAFLWNALGVPSSQAQMFLNETTTEQFAIDTLDPVAYNTHINSGAYHYQVCLEQKYTKDSCPLYLTRAGFEHLKANEGERMKVFRLHTDSIINVLRQLGPDNTLTIAILMDHMDWFPNSIEAEQKAIAAGKAPSTIPCDLTLELRALHQALQKGGRTFFRTAAINPWYVELFRREGFSIERIHAREIGHKMPIDRVNMYASFWKAVKI